MFLERASSLGIVSDDWKKHQTINNWEDRNLADWHIRIVFGSK